MRKLWPGLLANLAAAIFGVAMLDRLPARVASHWDATGHVNGYSSRVFFVALIPVMSLVMAIVLTFAPRLDPRRRNFPLHAGAYWIVTNAVLIFLALVHVGVIGYNLGWKLDFQRLMGCGLGALFVLIGNVMTQVRPNWIFGIRTPWTLSSDRAWRETHRYGGYGFVVAGSLGILSAVIAPAMMYIVLGAGLGTVALFSVVWSYFAWKRDPEATGRDP